MKLKTTGEIFRYALGALITIGFFGLLWLILVRQVPVENKDLLNIAVGALIGAFGMVTSFFFGSSVGSAKKTDIMADQQATITKKTELELQNIADPK